MRNKIEKTSDLISVFMEGLRPSKRRPQQSIPYGFLSGDSLDGIIKHSDLLLLLGDDPLELLVNLMACEAALWEHPCLLICTAAHPAEFVVRLLSSISGVSSGSLSTQRADPRDYPTIHEAAADLFHAKIGFWGPKVMDLHRLRALTEQMANRGTRTVYIDDVEALCLRPKSPAATEDLPQVCSELKKIARDHGVAFVGGWASMDLKTGARLADSAVRLEDLGKDVARLGVLRKGVLEPKFHLLRLDSVCGRLGAIRPCPWEATLAKRFNL